MSDGEAEQSQAGPGAPAPDGSVPGQGGPGRAGRVRGVLTSRAAGWVVAAVLAGAVVALSITMATIGSNPVRFAVGGRWRCSAR